MPDQSRAADEHAILQEITAPLASLPDDPLPSLEETDFPRVRRGYDPLAVDAYVRKTNQLIADLQARRSPDAAVRRALERVGEQISGILQRAHDTAEQITTQSRAEAEDRLEQARQEAIEIARAGEQRIKDLDADADRIWAERLRIIEDARELASQLTALADAAAERFPPADESTGGAPAVGLDEETEDEVPALGGRPEDVLAEDLSAEDLPADDPPEGSTALFDAEADGGVIDDEVTDEDVAQPGRAQSGVGDDGPDDTDLDATIVLPAVPPAATPENPPAAPPAIPPDQPERSEAHPADEGGKDSEQPRPWPASGEPPAQP